MRTSLWNLQLWLRLKRWRANITLEIAAVVAPQTMAREHHSGNCRRGCASNDGARTSLRKLPPWLRLKRWRANITLEIAAVVAPQNKHAQAWPDISNDVPAQESNAPPSTEKNGVCSRARIKRATINRKNCLLFPNKGPVPQNRHESLTMFPRKDQAHQNCAYTKLCSNTKDAHPP